MQVRTYAWLWLVVPVVLCCSTEAQTAPKAPSSQSVAAAPPTVVFSPSGRPAVRVAVEIAAKPAERQRGLMYRKHMDKGAGMLFIFDEPQQLTFWMHNTYLPLDMIFVTDAMTILGVVENATPLTDDPRGVKGMSRYVVEVNAGFAREHGLVAGTKVSFANVP